MINEELVDFIRKSIMDGLSKEQIKVTLTSGGWSESDIEEGYLMVTSPSLIHQANIDKRESSTLLNEYAGFWIRVLSFLIDGFVYMILSIPLIVIVGIKNINNTHELIMGLFILIFNIVMIKKYNATLGKMAVGIKIISEKSNELTLWQIILREFFGKFISRLLLGIGYLAVAFTSKKQGFHDLIAKTLVVYK